MEVFTVKYKVIKYSLYEKPRSVDDDGYDFVHTRRVGARNTSLDDDFQNKRMYLT